MTAPLDKYEADAWEGDAGLLNQAYTFDSPDVGTGVGLNVGVAGATVRPAAEMQVSAGTVLNGVLIGGTPDSDNFSAEMHGPDAVGLTNANNSLAANMLSSMKTATDEQFGGSRRGVRDLPQARGSFKDPALADALHMALEQGVEASVYLWAAQSEHAGTTPSVDPDSEIWSSAGGGILSHQAVQAEQAQGLLEGGQGWYDRFMTGDIYEGVWSGDPDDGIWSHQEILNEQARVLARGWQNPLTRFFEGDIFAGYRDFNTGEITYSAQDAREVALKMAMYNADRSRYSPARNFLWENNQPGVGFEADTDAVWSDIGGVSTHGDVLSMSRSQRFFTEVFAR